MFTSLIDLPHISWVSSGCTTQYVCQPIEPTTSCKNKASILPFFYFTILPFKLLSIETFQEIFLLDITPKYSMKNQYKKFTIEKTIFLKLKKIKCKLSFDSDDQMRFLEGT